MTSEILTCPLTVRIQHTYRINPFQFRFMKLTEKEVKQTKIESSTYKTKQNETKTENSVK